jgi:hypothetical protein
LLCGKTRAELYVSEKIATIPLAYKGPMVDHCHRAFYI